MKKRFVSNTWLQMTGSRAAQLVVAGMLTTVALQSVPDASAATASNGVNLASSPLYISSNVPPIVMLNVTKDHQLYYRAYNDYTDLNDDGSMDTTYNHNFNYYGYFDYGKCYTYDTALGYFVPQRVTSNKYCQGSSSEWSGNFLNWVSMSRIDVLRKVLYGGTRSTDTASLTVLERSFLPTDAHAWVKYYNGNDLNQLTPFTSSTEMSASFNVSAVNQPSVPASADSRSERTITVFMNPTTIDAQVGDQVMITSPSAQRIWQGNVFAVNGTSSLLIRVHTSGMTGPANANETGTWTARNLTRAGISFCNVTYAASGTSQTVTAPPLIRVVRGDYSLWAANERQQCLYASERGDTTGDVLDSTNYPNMTHLKNNGNRTSLSGLAASSKNPPTTRGLFVSGLSGKPDYNARVKVCVSTLIGNENCKVYGTDPAQLKPIGLLQEFGEGSSPTMRFALMTGSYNKNISGGVLRREAKDSLAKTSYAESEINPADGTFTSVVGIVRTLDRLRMYGYQYGSSDGYTSADSCDYQQMGMVHSGGGSGGSPANEGNCSSWGNPMGELYLESLRYLAGKSGPSAGFSYSGGKDVALNLPQVTSWTDPIAPGAYCTPLTSLVFNSSSVTFDDDQYSSVVDLNASTSDLVSKTNAIGAAELASSQINIGNNGTINDNQCSAKPFTTLSQLSGICPEAPALSGTYKMAGLAYLARTQRIRTMSGIPSTDTTSLKVQTYGVQLASSIPVIKVMVSGRPVTITPTYRLVRGSAQGGGTLVDFRPIGVPDNVSGKFYIAWEDSSQGGDYDQDVWGLLEYTVVGEQIKVRTKVISYATNNAQGFGYTIQGTDRDGVHFFSGIINFNYDEPLQMLDRLKLDSGATPVAGVDQVNANGGCRQCTGPSQAITATYNVSTSATSSPLKDPLFYAAKWGGLVTEAGRDETPNDMPDSGGRNWDVYNNSTGAVGRDYMPDNYFYVINPMQLQDALRRAFIRILTTGSSSGVAANSYSLSTDSFLYLAGFNTRFWSGWIKAHRISTEGVIAAQPTWTTDSTMTGINDASRVVYTSGLNSSGSRVASSFRWDQITAAQQAALNSTDSLGERRLNYVRGSATDEGSVFRRRSGARLGDIVNSSPIYVGRPTGRYDYPITQFNNVYTSDTSFATWKTGLSNRRKMVYVGANDGMLHGFDALDGTEKVAYVPSSVYSQLPALTSPAYTHQYLVDGAITVADAKFSTTTSSAAPAGWNTVLVGALGAGGRGVYALNVTNPEFVESGAASAMLWEFSNANDADLGYTLSAPLIVKMNNNRWMAVFGNGYFKTGDTVNTGRAKLFLLDIERGADGNWATNDFVTIDTGVGSSTSPNGLGNLAAIDTNLDGTPDYIFAGDLKGNLWKFDVRSSNSNSWAVAYRSGSTPLPVITVCEDKSTTITCDATRLPITQAPVISYHPTSYNSFLVYFGTGKYLESSDQTSTSRGWMYGVWDNGASLGSLAGLSNTQMLTQELSLVDGVRKIVNSQTPIWGQHKLWRFQLLTSGERLSGAPRLFNRVLLFTTYIPDSAVCSQQGTGWLMGVGYDNGGQVDFNLFDTDSSGTVSGADVTAVGIDLGNHSTTSGLALFNNTGPGSEGSGNVVINTTDGETISKPVDTPWTSRRVSWREMFRE